MGDELVIVPSDGDGYVNLARTKTGRLFKKHLLSKGQLRHPANGSLINVDDEFLSKLKANFDSGVCPIVQVPLANKNNEHSEEPDRNIGEVVDVEIKDGKAYAVLDIRDPAHADRFGKTYLGASAMLSLDYEDTKTGKRVGPTLLHSCVTNRPYVTDLDDYEEIVAATADSSHEAAVLLSETVNAAEKPAKETEMPDQPADNVVAEPTLEELLAKLKEKHNIDVSALQATSADAAKQTALSNTIVDALKGAGIIKLSNTEQLDTGTVVTAVQDLAANNITLSGRVQALESREAEHAVDALIAEGRILPAQRAPMVELKLTNSGMFDQLVPATPLVKLTDERGANPPNDQGQKQDIDADIKRLSELANVRR